MRANKDTLGPYTLIEEIGRGGQGAVYLAEDTRLKRKVALKVISAVGAVSESQLTRFRREAESASKLDHPSICTIHEAGDADGVPFIAMRYVEGDTLAQAIGKRNLYGDPSEADSAIGPTTREGVFRTVELIEKVARALHHAHDQGLIHRDIKPGNVIVTRAGEPIVLDFGLARDELAERHTLTHSGDLLGTPAYMSPEQLVAQRIPLDRRTDVYSLGATLYECLTLKAPFRAATRAELYQKIISGDPSSVVSENKQIPRDLQVVVETAMERDRDRRYQNALDFAEDLRRIRQFEPIRAKQIGKVLRLKRWAQRNPTVTGILLATLVGLATSLWLLRLSMLSETRLRALAWVQAATEVEDPELAFRYAREALRLHDHPKIVATIQEIMFDLRQYILLLSEQEPLSGIGYSPDGEFLIVGIKHGPALFRRHEDGWRRLPFPDTEFSPGWGSVFAFSPDSQELAIPSDKGVRRYDLRGDAPRALDFLAPGPDPPNCWRVSYSPDGHRLLANHSGRWILWTRNGEKLRVLEGMQGWAAAFLPDGRIVANGWLWDAGGKKLGPLAKRLNAFNVLVGKDRFFVWGTEAAETPGPGDMVLSTGPGQIFAFDFEGHSLDLPRDIQRGDVGNPIRHSDLDPSGERLLLLGPYGRFQLRDATTFDLLSEWRAGIHGDAYAGRFSPDGERIANGTSSGLIQIWSLDGSLMDEIRGHQGKVTSGDLAWSPDGTELASVGRGGTARVWNLTVREGVPVHAGHGWPDVAASASGEEIVFTSKTGALVLCDAGGKILQRQAVDIGRAFVRFTKDHRVVVGTLASGVFFEWEPSSTLAGEQQLREIGLRGLRLRLSAPESLPGDRWLVQGTGNALCVLKEKGLEPLELFKGPAFSFAVSEDRAHVLWGAWNKQVELCGLDGEVIWRSPEHLVVPFVTFSRSGRRVLAAADDRNAYLWDLEDPESEATIFRGHKNSLIAAIFSPDETRIATASHDGSIRIWDRGSRRTILRLRHEGVQRIVFSATGQLVSAGHDGTVRWWWLEAGPLRRSVEQLGIGELSAADRERAAHLLDQ